MNSKKQNEPESSVVSRKSSVIHVPVLLHESIDGLELALGKTFLDGTFGGGGHTGEVIRRYGEKVKVIALDQDPEVSSKFKVQSSKVDFYTENFRNLDKALERAGIGKVDAILFDLGISSDQLEDSGRGFSFQKDEPLDMRMSRPLTPERSDGEQADEGLSAAVVVNTFPEDTLELIIRGFGEERYSKRIARAIVEGRAKKPYKTTYELVATIEETVPKNYERGRIHPATRTFQALRITVNEELQSLEEGIEKGLASLAEGGRFAIISFHSLEDRVVKNAFRDAGKEGSVEIITKKPITPSEEERQANPRARSAKLRIIKKI